MNTSTCRRCLGLTFLLLIAGAMLGCHADDLDRERKAAPPRPSPDSLADRTAEDNPGTQDQQPGDAPNERPEPKIDPTQPVLPQAGKILKFGPNVFVEFLPGDQRRVLVNSYVVQRQVMLEQFLCRKFSKEHEAILAADVDARNIHAALLASRAKPGSPVQFQPNYRPAFGQTIKVLVQYKDKRGMTVTLPAQKWLRDAKTRKEMDYQWVFAGSRLVDHPEAGKPPNYAANGGDVICVSNFDDAMLDLPVRLSADNSELAFHAWTDRIPPLGTVVQVILEPVPEKKK